MKALYFNKNIHLIDDYPVPVPAEGEALIKVEFAGICTTDLEIFKGYKDFCGIPGHEFVGKVVTVNDYDQSFLWKKVTGEINISCHQPDCVFCKDGHFSHCPKRKALGISGKDGCFAEYVTLPLCNLHVVPELINSFDAVFIEPLAAALRIVRQIKIKHDDNILVIGDGKLGLLVYAVLQNLGTDVKVLGHHPERELLFRNFSLKYVNRDFLSENSFSTIVECTGNCEGIRIAQRLCKPLGKIVLKSTFTEPALLNLTESVVKEITLMGSRCGDFSDAIEFIGKGFKPSVLIRDAFPLDKFQQAFSLAASKGNLKVLFQIDDSL